MPSFEGGGVEKNIILIINYFIRKNIQVSLITASKKVAKKIDPKIKFIAPQNFFWDNFSRAIKYIVCIMLLIKEYIFNKNFFVFCFQGNLICISICKILRIKVVIRPNSSPSGWSNNILKKALFSKVFSWSNHIIVNSLKFKYELKKKFKLNSKCIYNPLNILQIKRLSKKKIKFNLFKRKTINLIALGRLVDQKDFITLLKAINKIKSKLEIRLLIIGEGDQKLNLISYINENKLNNIVKIKDRIENPYPYILKSDVMILTSKYEGLPNVLLEGLALNKFIISSNCPTGPSEILDRGKGGFLFRTGNYNELGNKIINYKRNKRQCDKLRKFSVSRLYRFDFKENLEKYYNIFLKI